MYLSKDQSQESAAKMSQSGRWKQNGVISEGQNAQRYNRSGLEESKRHKDTQGSKCQEIKHKNKFSDQVTLNMYRGIRTACP